jgi:hypothetical protein
MQINWLAAMDLAALIAGSLSALLLARAFGPPPKDFGNFSLEIKIASALDIVTVNRPDLFSEGWCYWDLLLDCKCQGPSSGRLSHSNAR